MKKILVFYGAYGGGHIAAANSITNHIKENYPNVEIESIDCIEYINKYVNKISTGAYRELAKKAPWMWEMIYTHSNDGALAKFSTASNKIMAVKLKNLIKEINPDLIISTHPFSSQMCSYLRKKGKINCKIATVMTDFHIHNQWLYLPEYVDNFFVSNESMKKALIEKEIPEEKIHVTGIPVSPRFLENFKKEEIYKEFELDPDKFTILFFAGGEFGLGRKTARLVLRAMIRLLKNAQVLAISGKNQKMFNAFSKIVERTNSSDRIKVIKYTNKVPELMSISNVVVTKAGGLTISESLTSHLPIIIINPIPGQEEENAEFLIEENLAIWPKTNREILNTIKSFVRHPEKLDKMKEKTYEFSKPYATKEICEILLKK